MAQIIVKESQAWTVCQLDTYNHTATAASPYFVKVDASEIPPSGLSIAIKQNGSTKITSIAPSASQSPISVQIVLNCALNDLISVVLSSAVASDTQLNVVKATINIHKGLQ